MNDPTRQVYRELTDTEKDNMRHLKGLGNDLIAYCNTIGSSRELSLAVTKIEEAVMWAVKHITR